jgi:hypothetical protein
MSRQIGHSQRSSDKLDAEKFENFKGCFCAKDVECASSAGGLCIKTKSSSAFWFRGNVLLSSSKSNADLSYSA